VWAPKITSLTDALTRWAEAQLDLPNDMCNLLDRHEEVHTHLRDYGAALTPLAELGVTKLETAEVGSLLSMVGGVLHSGPASKEVRVVLFFTSRSDPGVLHYNPTDQFYSVTSAAHIVVTVWAAATPASRLALLHILWYHVRECGDTWNCVDHSVHYDDDVHKYPPTPPPSVHAHAH
jgi:hypothetical protein